MLRLRTLLAARYMDVDSSEQRQGEGGKAHPTRARPLLRRRFNTTPASVVVWHRQRSACCCGSVAMLVDCSGDEKVEGNWKRGRQSTNRARMRRRRVGWRGRGELTALPPWGPPAGRTRRRQRKGEWVELAGPLRVRPSAPQPTAPAAAAPPVPVQRQLPGRRQSSTTLGCTSLGGEILSPNGSETTALTLISLVLLAADRVHGSSVDYTRRLQAPCQFYRVLMTVLNCRLLTQIGLEAWPQLFLFVINNWALQKCWGKDAEEHLESVLEQRSSCSAKRKSCTCIIYLLESIPQWAGSLAELSLLLFRSYVLPGASFMITYRDSGVNILCSSRSFFGVEDFVDEDNSRPYTYKKEKRSKNPHKHISFKQRTIAYMEPFTLDVFISKRFVSASLTHRSTCRQVAVAGTNSKDIKAVLQSRSDIPACLAVGRFLAERAKESDVYTCTYTPRERDKFEGKIRAVVQSLIDNGINVKLYLD
ncbi:hypothetical protein PR202_gb07439 [Eleusine coracana subsp. coracana]|uniref:L18 ribosomal protein Heart Stopper n=1 Tax=Eleusine coracana subsp. coracana TaxID=191504 RepID=A0AAV5EAF6_ELECO|nr:hypothetical protein PR202_gb07439 [Eleusine coracana subsp. coracana]